MQTVNATFEDGVLRPLQPLDLPVNAQVRITIELLPKSSLTVGKLDAFLRNLPDLGDDAEAFANEIRTIRGEFPVEPSAWD